MLTRPESYPENSVIIFPSGHDISQFNVSDAITHIRELLKRGNHVIISTKSKASAVGRIVRFLKEKTTAEERSRVSFRISIGTADEVILRRLEPGAPDFQERLMTLRELKLAKFSVGVTCTPLLGGVESFGYLYAKVKPYITDSIIVGRFTATKELIARNSNGSYSEDIIESIIGKQTDEEIVRLYEKYKDDPRVTFTSSILDVIKNNG